MISYERDPTLDQIFLYQKDDSQSKLPIPLKIVEPTTFSRKIETVAYIPSKTIFPSIYVDQGKARKLKEIKKAYDSIEEKLFIQARNSTNPFEGLGKSIFRDRAGVKLANIDAIFGISSKLIPGLVLPGQVGGFPFPTQLTLRDLYSISPSLPALAAPYINRPMTFCDVAGGPGAWSEYLIWRHQNNVTGHGISLLEPGDSSVNWSPVLTAREDFVFNGESNTGNLYIETPAFIDFVLGRHPEGVDLVMADGGFSTTDNYEAQETASTRLILSECLIGLSVGKIGSTLLFKVFETVTEFMAQLLYLLANSYKEVYIFKPLSSRPGNSERYVICQGLREMLPQAAFILRSAWEVYTDEQYVKSLINEPLPSDFIFWLTNLNNQSFDRQIETGEEILSFAKDPKNRRYITKVTDLQLLKICALWDIPERINTNRSKN